MFKVLMDTSEIPTPSFPSDLKVLATISLFLASLALLIGVPLLIANFSLPSFDNVEHDTFENMELSFRYLYRSLGLLGTLGGTFAALSSVLTLHRSRVGWLMLLSLYLGGCLSCLYLLVLFFDLLTRYPNLPLPSYPIMGLLFGIIGIVILIRKQNINYVFKKSIDHLSSN